MFDEKEATVENFRFLETSRSNKVLPIKHIACTSKKVSIGLRNTKEQEKIKKLQRQAKKKSVIANLLI